MANSFLRRPNQKPAPPPLDLTASDEKLALLSLNDRLTRLEEQLARADALLKRIQQLLKAREF